MKLIGKKVAFQVENWDSPIYGKVKSISEIDDRRAIILTDGGAEISHWIEGLHVIKEGSNKKIKK